MGTAPAFRQDVYKRQGVDDGNGGSDTNILVAVDAENGKIHGVSIPRDTKAVIAGKNRKINFAYNSGGASLLAETVGTQLGIPLSLIHISRPPAEPMRKMVSTP